MRKVARAGAADKKIEDWFSPSMDQLLRLAAKQYRRPANCTVRSHARARIISWGSEFCVGLADERVRTLGRFDTAFACKSIECEQDRISRHTQMVGQLPGAWNVAAGPQFSVCYQLADLVADLFVQRPIAAGFNLERNLNGGWTTNCGRGCESGAYRWRQLVRYDFYVTHLAPQQICCLRLVPSFFFLPVLSAKLP